MQKKKIFIEIYVPGPLKRRLLLKTAQLWSTLPVKWMKEENMHITVSFIGYVDESVIPNICQKVREVASEFESFELEFEAIRLGPNPENPQTIQLAGKSSAELGKLNEAIEKALDMHPPEHKQFRPNITIGRIRKAKWDELTTKPVIEEKFNVTMSVDYVSVMESKGGGAEYISLEECPLA